jgi:hypothetical protein
MDDLYSFVVTSINLTDDISSLKGILIHMSRQMTECGIFIQRHTSGVGGRLINPFVMFGI